MASTSAVMLRWRSRPTWARVASLDPADGSPRSTSIPRASIVAARARTISFQASRGSARR